MDSLREPTMMDEVELAISRLPAVDFPVTHLFTPGIYVRQTLLPAGSILTSRQHKTEHPFIILSGTVEVRSNSENIRYTGPVSGVTPAGTKRILFAVTDTVWLTIHANPEDIQNPDEIGERITEPDTNPFFENKDHPRLNQWRQHPTPKLA